MIKISRSVRTLLASLPVLTVALAPATVLATPAAAATGPAGVVAGAAAGRADLEFAWRPESTDVSYLGGRGARAFVQAFVTNIGTRAAARVTFHFTPPPGSTMDPAENEQFGWTCDTSTATWACTNGRTVGAGEVEGLNLTVLLPAGTVGDTVTMRGSVSTTTRERSLSNNSGETTFRYVVPSPADIAVNSVSVNPAQQVKANQEFDLHVEIDNAGGSPAHDVTVRIPLPPTVRAASLDPDHPDWSCALVGTDADRAVECAHDGVYDVTQVYNWLRLRLVAGPGTPDGPLVFTATAATTSPEESTGNNTAQGGTVYFTEGTMSGRAWLDVDRDGRRDADEPSAYGKVGKIEFVLEGTEPDWDVPRAHLIESGTYFARLKPGRYVANVYLMVESPYRFTVPDVGDDAGDSDVIGSSGDYYHQGWSAVVEVTDAGEAVVDIGLVPLA
ncbi:hypothetical protein [Actinoplanes xinjiangensis]|uniref:hypothetical protein n=1 Tax=Actinoplanes xinjiangensis TaxID=512350 RepID=UPI00344034A9